MSAYKSSIFDLLSTGNLAIPDYQRPYKWTKRNIEELLTDISKAIPDFDNDSPNSLTRVRDPFN